MLNAVCEVKLELYIFHYVFKKKSCPSHCIVTTYHVSCGQDIVDQCPRRLQWKCRGTWGSWASRGRVCLPQLATALQTFFFPRKSSPESNASSG